MKVLEKFMILLFTCVCVLASAQDATQNYILQERNLDSSGKSKNTSISYIDGMGRPCRYVTNSLGMAGMYVSSMTLYDECNRPSKVFFSIPIGHTPYFVTEQVFQPLSQSYYMDGTAYKKTAYDGLQRITSIFRGGDLWRENNKSMATEYGINNAPVKRYVPFVLNGKLQEKTAYSAGRLHMEKTTDEDGKTLTIYKNMLGQKVLERRDMDVDTYYVYDDIGNLRFVLSPNYQVDENLETSAYEYRYDGKGRCVWKRLPGAQHVQIWYDNNDRVIFEQDAVMRSKGLSRFYLYDGLGRLTIQGITKNTDYSCLDATTVFSNNAGFQNTGYVLKQAVINPSELEVVNYYDTYDFLQCPAFAKFCKAISQESATHLPMGLQTGSMYMTSQGDTLYKCFFYNKQGLLEKENALYPNNAILSRKISYSFTDQPIEENVTITRNPYTYEYKILNKYSLYNDKIEKVELILPGKAPKLIAKYSYDDIGRLVSVTHGEQAETTNYRYDFHGATVSISSKSFSENLFYAVTDFGTPCYNGNISSMTWKTSNEDVLRGYTYSYDGLNRLLISIYGEGQDLSANKNNYTENILEYDGNSSVRHLQRYGRKNDGTFGVVDDLLFVMDGNHIVSITDKSDRLLYANSFDFKQTSDASYTYNANGSLTMDPNKGMTISYDNFGTPKFVSFNNGNSISYAYTCKGEKISVLHQTNPLSPLSSDMERLSVENQASMSLMMEYVGDVILEQGSMSRILFKDGYYSFSDSLCHYFTKDHLGSIRTVVDERGVLEQVNHYYPFGGLYGDVCYNASFQEMKYNGKALDRMYGLDWYDYGARMFDSAVLSWWKMDPLAESTPYLSPYSYCGGNPVRRIDHEGMFFGDYYDSRGRLLGNDGIVDDAVYVMRTTKSSFESYGDAPVNKIPRGQARAAAKEICTFNGDASHDFSNARESFVKLDGSREIRKEVLSCIEDDGTGGTSDKNNREYGMNFDSKEPLKVYSRQGPVAVPGASTIGVENPDAPSLVTVHSHPSGNIVPGLMPAPSAADVENCNQKNNSYVIAMSNKMVYIYNKTGIIASFPLNIYTK